MKTAMNMRNGFDAFGVLVAAFFVGSLHPHAMVVHALEFNENYIPYNTDNDSLSFGDFGPYTFDDPLRQHLHLYQQNVDGEAPSPVLLWAHANGGKANDLGLSSMNKIASAGFSIISWESATLVKTAEDVQTCLSDFDLVWSWYQQHASEYNLDPNFAIVGGRSRGSVCSWQMAHSAKPEIRGIYMYNALPDSVWKNSEAGDALVEMVTSQSPPAFLGYGPECPKPIQQDCVPSPDPTDGHSPRNGQTIVDRYAELGMQYSIYLADGFHNHGIGLFDDFEAFASTIQSSNNDNDAALGKDPLPTSEVADDSSCADEFSLLCPPSSFATKSCEDCAKANYDNLASAGCTKKMVTSLCWDKKEWDKGAAAKEEWGAAAKEEWAKGAAAKKDKDKPLSTDGSDGSESAFASSVAFADGRNYSVSYQMISAVAILFSVLLLQ